MEERQEIIPLKIKSADELAEMENKNKFLRVDIENQFNDFISVTMKKINESNNVKQDFGRSILPSIAKNVGTYIKDMHLISLEREKFEWAKEVWKSERVEKTNTGSNIDKHLSEGVQINFLVNGSAEKIENDKPRTIDKSPEQIS